MDTTSDSGYIIAGQICSPGGIYGEAFLMRVDSTGNILWAKIYKEWEQINPNEITRTAFFDVKPTLDGGFIAVGEASNFFTRDAYIVKTDANGNSGCSNDSAFFPSVNSINISVVDSSTQVGSGGIVGSYTANVSSTNTTDSTLCFDTIVGINENIETGRQPAQMQVFPNPFSHAATITFDLPGILDAVLSINDISGRTVATYKLSPPYREVEITSTGLENGIYFARIVSENRTLAATKIIVLK